MNSFLLLPTPRQIQPQEGFFPLAGRKLILLDAPQPQLLRSAAARLQGALGKLGLDWQQTASTAVPADRIGLTLRVAPERAPYPQGYRLHIGPAGVVVEGHEPEGVFYGACTLVQLIEQVAGNLPGMEIFDWPDIAVRGVMLDISRDKVYRMETLYELVDRLAGWKINQLQLYTEHTFAYQNHPTVWAKASPITGEEIMALDAYCHERFIELVPNQNSFGHMERWLVHEPYADLAETHDWYETPWADHQRLKGPFSLAPEHPGSFPLVQSLYDELLPHFHSKQVNVGCDETIDLGQGASRAICEARGTGRVYFDFLLRIYADLKKRGYSMQFWGDIINNDHPELAAQLPRDVIALNWGYDAAHPFNVECARFAASGVPFYVCPGTSTWCSIAGRTDNALANLLNAAENGIRYHAIGYLNTDWGDRGHWQAPPVSYLGFAAGAAYSWALEANRDMNVPAVVSRYAFEDEAGVMGQVAYDLGNIYQVPQFPISNGSVLFWALQLPLDAIKQYSVDPARLRDVLDAVDAAVAPLSAARMQRPDADLILREFRSTARILRHGARRAMAALEGGSAEECKALAADLGEIIEEYRALWLERARPGGLAESAGRFEAALRDYLE